MKRRSTIDILLLSIVLLAAGFAGSCSDDSGGGSPLPNEAENEPAEDDTDQSGPERSYELTVPSSYTSGSPAPLIMLLHGYGGTPDNVSAYFGMEAAAQRHGFILVRPEGMVDSQDKHYWNATDACCAFDPEPADDVAYLTGVLDEVTGDYNIDPRRVYIVGHSNGGFMTHRMACELAPRIAAVASLAGVSWDDASRCDAAEPVSVLQLHGDMDQTIFYRGGTIAGTEYPSAFETVSAWADKNGCTGDLVDRSPMELVVGAPADETRVQEMKECPEGGAVELWTIIEGGHIPDMVENWLDFVWTFLQAHPKP